MKEAQETMNERPFLLLLHDLIVDLEFDLTKKREKDAHRHDPLRTTAGWNPSGPTQIAFCNSALPGGQPGFQQVFRRPSGAM